MYQLIIKSRAVLMQQEAYYWYEQQKQGLGERFINELEDKYHKISNNPTAYGKRNDSYRHIVLRKFPYVIVFRIIEKTVVVYAVFHTSRNPKDRIG